MTIPKLDSGTIPRIEVQGLKRDTPSQVTSNTNAGEDLSKQV
jgi:hypothetical protein